MDQALRYAGCKPPAPKIEDITEIAAHRAFHAQVPPGARMSDGKVYDPPLDLPVPFKRGHDHGASVDAGVTGNQKMIDAFDHRWRPIEIGAAECVTRQIPTPHEEPEVQRRAIFDETNRLFRINALRRVDQRFDPRALHGRLARFRINVS
jgi:hypothetical protein